MNEHMPNNAMNRHDYLLKRYREKVATEEEINELAALNTDRILDSKDISEDANSVSSSLFEKIQSRKRITVKEGHDEKEVIPIKRFGISTWSTAAAITGILLAVGNVLYNNYKFQALPHTEAQPSEIAVTFTGSDFIIMPDGSTVMLNGGSELYYTKAFGSNRREVFLKGEAYFDIKHDPKKPFIVNTGILKTIVLGTAFNVKAYQDQPEITVTVVRGKVEVRDTARVYGRIHADEQFAVNTATNDCQRIRTNPETVLTWKSKFLILDGITVEKAAALIAERFDAQITLTNDSAKKCRINAAFVKDEDLEQVIKVISAVLQATYTIDNNNVTIEGGRSCKEPTN